MSTIESHIVCNTEFAHWGRLYHSDPCSGDAYHLPPKHYAMTMERTKNFISSFDVLCKRCKRKLVEQVHSERGWEFNNSGERTNQTRKVFVCKKCGWWYAEFEFVWHPSDYPEYDQCISSRDIFEGIIQRFPISSQEAPLSALKQHLREKFDDVRFLNPNKFELFVADIYKDFYQCEVRHVGGPGDNGIDLYVVISDEPHLVQVKRRESLTYVESIATVREFVGTVFIEGAKKGHIVTTASKYSKPATELAGHPSLKRYGIEIELKTRSDLAHMLCLSTDRKTEPWSVCDPRNDSDLEQSLLLHKDNTTDSTYFLLKKILFTHSKKN